MSETDGTTVETQAAETTEAPAAQPDFSAFNDRMDQVLAQQQEMMQTVQQFQQAQAPAEPEAEEQFDFNEYQMDDPAQAQAALAAFVQQQVSQALGQHTGQSQEMQAQLQRLQASIDARELESKYPELQDEESAASLLDQAAQYAQQMAATPEQAQSMVLNSGFLELVYLAQRGIERAAGETPAGGQVSAGLEDASGGTPGGAEPNLADQIRAGREVRNPLFGV